LVARTDAEITAWRRDDKIRKRSKSSGAVRRKLRRTARHGCCYRTIYAKAGQRNEQVAVLDSLINRKRYRPPPRQAERKTAANDPKGALSDFRKASADGPDETRVEKCAAGIRRLEMALEENEALDKLESGPPVAFQKAFWWFYGGLQYVTDFCKC